MVLQNPYTKCYVEYPIEFSPEELNIVIQHETPFTNLYSEWAVSYMESGDVIYIPTGSNRSKKIYIVTSAFRYGLVQYPYGIYTIPFSHFTYKRSVSYEQDLF